MNRAAVIALFLVACGGAPPRALGDRSICEQACARLAGCGVAYDAACPAQCLQSPAFLACARTAADASDCNSLALCAFEQASVVTCGGPAAGYPSGAETCNGAARCEAVCGILGQSAACTCGCMAALAPGRAINLLINNQCAAARCGCTPGGDAAACLSCFQVRCQSENAQCAAH